jgi:hypothetical protein
VKARACGLAVLALALPFSLVAGRELDAATLDARSLAFVPFRYSAGDEVTVQAAIVPEAGEQPIPLDLRPGAGLRAQGEEADPELRELRLSRTAEGWLLALRFVPWSPGPGSIPELRIKGLVIPSLPYTALSLIGPEDRDPSPPRPQADPPGIALYLYGFAALLVILALGAAGGSAYLVPAARAIIARRRAAQAFRRFDKSLDYLTSGAGAADPAAYFAALTRTLRLYLAARALPEAPALTSRELSSLPESAFPAPATRDRTAALVARADRARYGGDLPEGARLRVLLEAAEEARAIGQANEEALLARV